MARVMAVSFERYGRLYYLDPGEADYRSGTGCWCRPTPGPRWPSVSGRRSGSTTTDSANCRSAPAWPLRTHLARDAANRRRRAEAKLVAKRLIKKNDLPMKVVGGRLPRLRDDFDELVVIYFSAPHRVDFRVPGRRAGPDLRARIDLRQVGSRDAARLIGGLGNCGRDLCCATFLKDFEPVSLRMAKMQDLPPNPLKISGACGRLMCCLKYEHPLYAEFAREVPAVGERVAMRRRRRRSWSPTRCRLTPSWSG